MKHVLLLISSVRSLLVVRPGAPFVAMPFAPRKSPVYVHDIGIRPPENSHPPTFGDASHAFGLLFW